MVEGFFATSSCGKIAGLIVVKTTTEVPNVVRRHGWVLARARSADYVSL